MERYIICDRCGEQIWRCSRISSISSISTRVYGVDENGIPGSCVGQAGGRCVDEPVTAGESPSPTSLSSSPRPNACGEGGGQSMEFQSDPSENLGKPIVPPEPFLRSRRRGSWESCTLGDISRAYAEWCRERGGQPVKPDEFLRALRRVAEVKRVNNLTAWQSIVLGISEEEVSHDRR